MTLIPWYWAVIAFVVGEFIGFFLAAILAAGRRADEHDPVERELPPRCHVVIWQGKNERTDK